ELERQIREIVNNIWDEIDKPNMYRHVQLTDMFDIDFYFIPHIIYERECFDERMEDLFRRFTDPTHKKYYFRTSYHLKKSVPAEGFYTWTKQIWDAIVADEALNIPDQHKLLSVYRCEHALQESVDKFQCLCYSIESEIGQGEVKDFGRRLTEMMYECITLYDTTARKYDAEVSDDKRFGLMEKLESKIQPLFLGQQEHINHKVLTRFKEELHSCLPNHECSIHFDQIVKSVIENCRKMWSSKMNDSLIDTYNKQFVDKDAFWKGPLERIRELTKGAQMEQFSLLQKEFEVK
ncbi:hypothetical protein RFI_14110, partial [Reticulomyxa filosa]